MDNTGSVTFVRHTRGRNESGHGYAGFTLIELVVVITIIGILASVALPRFVNMQRDARIAKLNGARGAVGASANIVHAALLAHNGADTVACPGTAVVADNALNGAGTVCTENGIVATFNGYPQVDLVFPSATYPGIIGAAGLTSQFNPTSAELTAEGYGVTGAAGVQTITILGAPTPATCSFTYTQPVVVNAAPITSSVVTAGC